MRRSPGSHPAARPAPKGDRDFEEVVGVYGGTVSLTATLVGASRAGTKHRDQVTRSVESTRWDGNRRTSTSADAPRSRAWLVCEALVVGALLATGTTEPVLSVIPVAVAVWVVWFTLLR